jgi:hypothetical protein
MASNGQSGRRVLGILVPGRRLWPHDPRLISITSAIALALTCTQAVAQSCALCSSNVVVVPATGPCMESELTNAAKKTSDFLTFDLSKCGNAVDSRGVVPGLPTPSNMAKRPTLRFVLQKSKLPCLNDQFEKSKNSLDPYAVLDLAACP